MHCHNFAKQHQESHVKLAVQQVSEVAIAILSRKKFSTKQLKWTKPQKTDPHAF